MFSWDEFKKLSQKYELEERKETDTKNDSAFLAADMISKMGGNLKPVTKPQNFFFTFVDGKPVCIKNEKRN